MFSPEKFQKLIKEKRIGKARTYLEQGLKQDPENERLWQWYAKIAPTPEAKKEAKRRIASLQKPAKDRTRVKLIPLVLIGLVIGFIVIVGIIVIGFNLFGNSANTVAALPTVAQLPSLTPTIIATEVQASAIPPTSIVLSSPTDELDVGMSEITEIPVEVTEPVAEATTEPSELVLSTSVSDVSSTETDEQSAVTIGRDLSAYPTGEVPVRATEITIISATEEATQPSADDSVSPESTQDVETDETTQETTPTDNPDLSSPEPTLDVIDIPMEITMTVPFQESFHIGIGTLRVLDAQRPANNKLKEIGVTSIPSPPQGHQWVMVEALLICDNEAACALPTPVIRGSSGEFYNVNNQIMLDVRFDVTGLYDGQIWGYLIYAVPQTESSLLLAVRPDEVFYFELQ